MWYARTCWCVCAHVCLLYDCAMVPAATVHSPAISQQQHPALFVPWPGAVHIFILTGRAQRLLTCVVTCVCGGECTRRGAHRTQRVWLSAVCREAPGMRCSRPDSCSAIFGLAASLQLSTAQGNPF
ncbi:hypothetical protein COO60DRAFT_323017 [Scenedesmus sp. NREL 46B-D3]|nr:hypothetical protein COO60DRAFT_323017 [Scenedesmus sp. NREL 46B-D3]